MTTLKRMNVSFIWSSTQYDLLHESLVQKLAK